MPYVTPNSTPLTIYVTVNKSKPIHLTLKDVTGKVVPPQSTVTWTTDDASIATVTNNVGPDAQVNGVAVGTTVIHAVITPDGFQTDCNIVVQPSTSTSVVYASGAIGEVNVES